MAEVVMYEEKIANVKWGTFVLLGLLALIFGIVIFIYPQIAAAVLVMLFGVLIIVLAFLALIIALMSTGETARPTLLLLAAILGFIVGIGSLLAPQFFAAIYAIIIAVVMFVLGVVNIAIALGEKTYPHRWILFLLGLLSIIFAIIVLVYPLFGAVVLFGFLVSAYFILYGILSIIAGFALRSIKKAYIKA
jgi:uncharacterized membrane protein HdeD (DUF308 family)